jgi:hypothetical protein
MSLRLKIKDLLCRESYAQTPRNRYVSEDVSAEY